MANDFNKPTVSDNYASVYTPTIKDNQTALAQALDPAVVTVTNPPTNAVRWNSANGYWEKYNGSSWAALAATYGISVSGNAGTATKLATARAINGVNFDGLAAISINLNNALTFNNGGAGGASGSTFNGGGALTVSYNTVGAPSTTGVGASGTWPISITGSSASCSGSAANANKLNGFDCSVTWNANSIVQRDGNGYIQNNYFYTSGGGAERNGSGMSFFAGFNSSDYYIRSYSPAAVAAAISGQTMNINGSSASCTGNAATATSASQLGGVAAANFAQYGANQSWSKGQRGAVTAVGNGGATVTLDLNASNNFSVTADTASWTLANPTNIASAIGQSGIIAVTQDATGSRVISWGSYFVAAGGNKPVLSTTAGAIDLISYYVIDATHILVSALKGVA